MSKVSAQNLLILVTQLLATEVLVIAPDVYAGTLTCKLILAPISLLTLAPIWALQDRAYGALLAILFIDIAFLSIMAFSIRKNHKVLGAVCLLVFNFIGFGLVNTY